MPRVYSSAKLTNTSKHEQNRADYRDREAPFITTPNRRGSFIRFPVLQKSDRLRGGLRVGSIGGN
ncbi:hypothetical protein PGT21_033346 [Puccinia graminis f. sp. tritici]|uniref:Uncharacterized protein n=1 Tax=Puccinia graminis f. sp. tritici TaxID=56615 RepID=A0A5B0QKC7_PUCGR|nr:hypothetical protein PGT21_033346 [Puccinia graminis f. sp. tritici]